MRLAIYNVENLFDRAKAMNLDTWDEGKPVLEAFAELNQLLGSIRYTDADKARMADLMIELGLKRSDTGPFVILRRNRGGLVKRPRDGGIEIVADGRVDWVGTLELRDEPVNELAMRHTARVMVDVGADVLGVVEAESRPVLSAFNDEILPAIGGTPFRHVMVIDGNDERGIDVGLVTREGFRSAQCAAMLTIGCGTARPCSPATVLSSMSRRPAATGSSCWSTISRARATDRPRSRTSDVERRRHVWPRSTRN